MNEPLSHVQPFPNTEEAMRAWLQDEEQCLAYVFHRRWPQGFQCPYCRWQHLPSTPHRHIVCSHCGHPSSITTNTIMHGSKKSLAQWLLAIWWLGVSDAETSAKNLQRLLHLSSYQTAWAWLQKLRAAMAAADGAPCRGLVEIGYAPVFPAWEKPQQALVIAAAEILLPTGITGRIKMAIIDTLEPASIISFLHSSVIPGSTLFPSGISLSPGLGEQAGYFTRNSLSLTQGTENTGRAEQLIKGVEIWLNKVHRGGVALKHLQLYLDEFCFRTNSVMLPGPQAIFNLLLQGVLAHKTKPYRELVSRQAPTRRVS